MARFENIPHVERIVYKRTFMNEITLLFTYNKINFESIREGLLEFAVSLGLTETENISGEDYIVLKDKDASVTFASNAVLVSLPSKEYSNFENTAPIWNDLEKILTYLQVNPIVWSFTKGNRWLFNKVITEDIAPEVYRVVFSDKLLSLTDEKHFFVEESTDKTCVVTCRYGIDKIREKDSIGLKIMIASQTYTVSNICEQVFGLNELMFDVWHWAVSENVKQIMQREN